MSQPTSLSAGSALGRQTCLVKYNINLSAGSAPGRQTSWLAHEDFCLKNWAIDVYGTGQPFISRVKALYISGLPHFSLYNTPELDIMYRISQQNIPNGH
jgi:hypothetical protein